MATGREDIIPYPQYEWEKMMEKNRYIGGVDWAKDWQDEAKKRIADIKFAPPLLIPPQPIPINAIPKEWWIDAKELKEQLDYFSGGLLKISDNIEFKFRSDKDCFALRRDIAEPVYSGQYLTVIVESIKGSIISIFPIGKELIGMVRCKFNNEIRLLDVEPMHPMVGQNIYRVKYLIFHKEPIDIEKEIKELREAMNEQEREGVE